MTTSRQHLTRRAMKQDEFVSSLTRATAWVEANSRSVLIAAGAIVAAAVLVGIGVTWARARAIAAYDAVWPVEKAASLPLAGEPGAGPSAPASPSARSEEVVAGADRALAGGVSGDAASWIRYYKAAALLDLGRAEEASKAIEPVVASAGTETLLGGLARLLAGRVEESRREFQKAADLYAAVATAAQGSAPADVALMDQARCLENLGKTQESISTLQKIVDVYPESPLAAKATERIQKLRG